MEVSAEIGNTFRELLTEVECTQTKATFGDAFSIEVILSLHAVVENKHSGTVLRLKG
jgi:hypothetical protein